MHFDDPKVSQIASDVGAALKPVYQAVDAEAAQAALDEFASSELGQANPNTVRVFEDAWERFTPVSYTHLTLPTILRSCRSRWSPYH